ncbi:hypothetical protein [uncultured Cohaesibacter sp.]|uniref:hypothetical protein n=1 Tax=uncultured Cohaesibacter sp. TaxID=1002546 RepID=UPI0029C97975|nr:hypothetical protein [uncultured Cohaesibacter sp.]
MSLEAAREIVRDNAKPNMEGASFPSRRWDLSDERAFVETLVNQRTTILLAAFSLTMGGAFGTGVSVVMKQLILIFGAVVCCLITLTVWRVQKKLDILIRLIKMDAGHPITVVDSIIGSTGSKRKLIGYALPSLYSIALVSAAIAAVLGLI